MIAGEFSRGQHRGGGKVVHATARDRVRALQLYRNAMKVAQSENDKRGPGRNAPPVRPGDYLRQSGVATAIAHRSRQAARLRRGLGLRRSSNKARPSTPPATRSSTRSPKLGTPPKATASAGAGFSKRWLNGNRRAATTNAWNEPASSNRNSACKRWPNSATCCRNAKKPSRQREKGQQNRHLGARHARRRRNHRPARHRRQALQTSRRAQLHQALSAGAGDNGAKQADGIGLDAARALALLFENRRQYPRAAEYWRQAIERSSGDPRKAVRQQRLDQIVGNWGQFETRDVAARRPRRHGRLPLPQRQASRVRRPRSQRPQAARRCESLSQIKAEAARLGADERLRHRLPARSGRPEEIHRRGSRALETRPAAARQTFRQTHHRHDAAAKSRRVPRHGETWPTATRRKSSSGSPIPRSSASR